MGLKGSLKRQSEAEEQAQQEPKTNPHVCTFCGEGLVIQQRVYLKRNRSVKGSGEIICFKEQCSHCRRFRVIDTGTAGVPAVYVYHADSGKYSLKPQHFNFPVDLFGNEAITVTKKIELAARLLRLILDNPEEDEFLYSQIKEQKIIGRETPRVTLFSEVAVPI